MIECRELFKVHRTAEGDAAALQGLSLEAPAGEMLAVLGPSGSGKSTLLRILAGLERPSAGRAEVAGADIGRLRTGRAARHRRALIGLVGQSAHRALPPTLTLAEAVALPLGLRRVPRAEAHARAGELLERTGLLGVRDAHPDEISGGERQRAAVCAAVAHRPRVVLADEPTGELDAHASREVLALLASLAGDGACVLLVTHDPAGAEAADRVVRIRDGRIAQEGQEHDAMLVVGRGGWLQIPERLLAAAGIGRHARARSAGGGILLEAPVGATAPAPRARLAAQAPPRPTVGPVTAELRAVSKAYGSRRVLQDLSGSFPPGRLTALTGRSGSGKTTLLRLLAGLEAPDAGGILIDGEPLPTGRAALAMLRAAEIGVVPQELDLPPFLTARELVALPHQGRAVDPEAWLAAVGLGQRAGQRAARLSPGERQRVAIARALAGGRGLVLVDEPTSHLDEENARRIAELLAHVAYELGASVVCATHDPIVAAAAHRTWAL